MAEARAIGQPRGDEITKLLEQYIILRRDFVLAPRDATVLDDLSQQTDALQSALWEQVSAIVRDQPNPVSVSLMASMNDVFDRAAAQRFAFEFRLPTQIFWILIGLSLIGMAALGYQLALRGSEVVPLTVLLAFTWTVVIVTILDLAASRLGYLQTSVAPYEWTLQSFDLKTTAPARQ
jgi:hypothetical protein